MSKKENIVAISMGDPAGIGPEIILQAFANHHFEIVEKLIIIGDLEVLKKVNNLLEFSLKFNELKQSDNLNLNNLQTDAINVLNLANIELEKLKPGQINKQAGQAAFEYVKKGVELAKKGKIAALVTAPINKKALREAGLNYPGHTEILAQLTKTEDYAMFLYSEQLKVIHVSTHISLLEACQSINRLRIEKVIKLAEKALNDLGITHPRIAVAGLNPHAGEKGLFGKEEQESIEPAISSAKKQGIDVSGPIPPDTVFVKAVKGEYDIVVVMYHDQGHIPVKLLDFDSGVNITVGLPIIRTSVDHGTAFDIAWQGKATDKSLVEAVKAAKLMLD